MTESFTVTLIATVKDERDSLDAWLAGIGIQERLPDEIIIVDGGSTDGTLEALQAWQPPCVVRVFSHPGASISQGRNIALKAASGDVVAITDCGTDAEADWLRQLVAPFEDDAIDVVSGFFTPDLRSSWDRALAATTLPDASEIRPERFLPSSRSVAVRATWVRSGFLYPEWLDYCEDLIWDLQLRNAGARFHTALDATVRFQVRRSLRSFFRQYFLYARGDGKAGLFGKRHAVRYATYAIALSVGVAGRPWHRTVLLIVGSAYVSRPLRRLCSRDRLSGVPVARSFVLMPALPLLMAAGDIAKMVGYPVGLYWRLRRFGTLHPARNWRRITPGGELWNPAERFEAPQQPED